MRREEAGLSVTDLAARTELSATAIEAYERGEGNLGTAHLLRIARVLEVDAGQLLHTNAPEDAAHVEPSVLLRSKGLSGHLSNADLEAIAAGMRRARAFTTVGELIRAPRLADVPDFRPAPAPRENSYVAGYELANRVRRLLPERPGTLKNLWRLLEDRFNILVLRYAFESNAIEGAACRSGTARVIFLNANLAFEGKRRFVLAHELAHHLVDLANDDITTDERVEGTFSMERSPEEKRANSFAVMFIAHEPELRRLLGLPGSVNIPGSKAKAFVEDVRRKFGLGPEAMTRHLQNLRYLSEPVADELVTELTGKDDDLRGFEDEPAYDGLERRVGAALDAGIITRGRARELLGLSPYEDTKLLAAL